MAGTIKATLGRKFIRCRAVVVITILLAWSRMAYQNRDFDIR